MKCGDARFAAAANPGSRDAALLAHLESCPACAAYADDMRELDRRLLSALAVPVPPGELPAGPHAVTPSTVPPGVARHGGRFTRGVALAAGVAGAAVLGGLLWIGVPRQSLAGAVVTHMAEEPDAWTTSEILPDAAIAEVMSAAGVRLDPAMPGVTYAHRCRIRGRIVPHLVVQSPTGPITILVLPHEPVIDRTTFDEDGYRGVLVPAERGSIAVLARDAGDVASVAAQALAAIRYVD